MSDYSTNRSRSRSRSLMSDDSPSHHKLRISSKSSKGHHKKHRSRHKKSSNRSRSHSNSRSRSREYSKRKKHKTKRKKRTRSRSPSSDSCSTSISSDYASYDTDTSMSSHSDNNSRKHKKKHKKHKHKNKNKSRKKKHSKKRKKKQKKHKKPKSNSKSKHKNKNKNKNKNINKSRDKTLLQGNLSIYKPSEYREGEHGFITPNDAINKMPEFTVWLADVHNVALDNLGKRDEKKWFAKFCDDWNTSTMPDNKYYDIDKWNKANGGGDNETADRNMTFGMSDEQRLNAEKRAARQHEQDRRYAARVQEMKKHLIDLKSHNQKEFQSLTDKHIPRKETFESLAAKRKAKKVEDRVKRFGKYDTNVSLD